jgi:hypothetical protein
MKNQVSGLRSRWCQLADYCLYLLSLLGLVLGLVLVFLFLVVLLLWLPVLLVLLLPLLLLLVVSVVGLPVVTTSLAGVVYCIFHLVSECGHWFAWNAVDGMIGPLLKVAAGAGVVVVAVVCCFCCWFAMCY